MADPRSLPVGTELGNGLRVGHGGVVTGSAVQLDVNQKEALMPANKKKAPARKSGSNGKPAWKSLPDDQLAAYLLEHQTIPDTSWSDRAGRSKRRKGESREAFIRRVLFGEETAS